MMVLGIFLYVGTEVCIGSRVPKYLEAKFGFDLETWGIMGSAFFFIWILIGRFLGSVVLNWMSAQKFLIITVHIALIGLLGLIAYE